MADYIYVIPSEQMIFSNYLKTLYLKYFKHCSSKKQLETARNLLPVFESPASSTSAIEILLLLVE